MDDRILERTTQNDGQLLDIYRPAIYLDTNLLIDYWVSEELSGTVDESHDLFTQDTQYQINEIMCDLLKSDKHIYNAFKLREKISDCIISGRDFRTHLVISSLSINELMAWNSKQVFKTYAMESAGPAVIERMSVKNIGDQLLKLLSLRNEEMKKNNEESIVAPVSKTPLQVMMSNLWLNPSFAHVHGFSGLVIAPIENFRYLVADSWNIGMLMSFLQIPLSDQLHIFAAKHLGCEYIASRDSDFKRAKSAIEELGMKLLNNTDDVMRLM